jgi:hypothetical protein
MNNHAAATTVANNYYVALVDFGITGSVKVNAAQLQNPLIINNLSSGIGSENPWIHFPGEAPRFDYELFPELFEH